MTPALASRPGEESFSRFVEVLERERGLERELVNVFFSVEIWFGSLIMVNLKVLLVDIFSYQ